MSKKDDKKLETPFNFGIDNSPVVKQTEQKLVEGYQRIESEEQSGVAAADGSPSGVSFAQQAATNTYQEPTQNINIPIPTSQHTRLKIISATSRQTMKDMVVQAIGLWLDVQEGKKSIGTNQV